MVFPAVSKRRRHRPARLEQHETIVGIGIGRNKDADARASYEALLKDLEDNFAARTEKMMLDDRSDMDIEINVLRDRLQREGVHLSNKGD